MKPSDLPKFQTAMERLGELFDRTITPGIAETYFLAMGDLTIEQFTQAAMILANTSRFFPKPVEFREAIFGKAGSRAELAWATLGAAVRLAGGMKSVYCDDPCLVAVIKRQFGGWHAACESLPHVTSPMHAAMRKQFLELYEGIAADRPTECYLMGRAEIENSSGGGFGRLLENGVESFNMPILVITNGQPRIERAAFSMMTGRLIEKSLLALPGMPESADAEGSTDNPVLLLASQLSM